VGLFPIDQAIDVAVNASLEWNAVVDADTYDLQVATDASFTKAGSSALVLDETGLTGNSYVANGLDHSTTITGTYAARMRAVQARGRTPSRSRRSST